MRIIHIVLADDLGYGDVKSFGLDRCQIETPHFDRLAREGMRFASAYASKRKACGMAGKKWNRDSKR